MDNRTGRFALLCLLLLGWSACADTAHSDADKTPKDSIAGAGRHQQVDPDSPQGTFQQMFETANRKDLTAYKALLSRASLAMLDSMARTQNTTLDDAIMKDMSNPQRPAEIPRMRNQQIAGDIATVEINVREDEWHPFPFVREEGKWKFALDRLIQDM